MSKKVEFITIDEAAMLAGVHEKTIRNWMTQGHITKYKQANNVRINKQELEQFLKPKKAN